MFTPVCLQDALYLSGLILPPASVNMVVPPRKKPTPAMFLLSAFWLNKGILLRCDSPKRTSLGRSQSSFTAWLGGISLCCGGFGVTTIYPCLASAAAIQPLCVNDDLIPPCAKAITGCFSG
ncbi:hypothetical protein [Neptunomonas concharum]|uniref:hypothetical protein n=1 Tax=Neptunomonas concharum TaxID=1031538 RepID=UPI003B82FB14